VSVPNVDIDIYQGEDWTCDVVWTDAYDEGIPVMHPCRMDIKTFGGQTIHTLVTDPDIPEGDVPGIKTSTNIGLIQLHIGTDVTRAINPGQYRYDLFVTTDDGSEYAGAQLVPVIAGKVNLHRRTTTLD